MVIKNRSIPEDGKRELTVDEFKRWLKRYDSNRDGRMSKEELADAIRGTSGGWFAGWKGKRAVESADSNGNGYVDETEINNLVDFAQKNLCVKIISM